MKKVLTIALLLVASSAQAFVIRNNKVTNAAGVPVKVTVTFSKSLGTVATTDSQSYDFNVGETKQVRLLPAMNEALGSIEITAKVPGLSPITVSGKKAQDLVGNLLKPWEVQITRFGKSLSIGSNLPA